MISVEKIVDKMIEEGKDEKKIAQIIEGYRVAHIMLEDILEKLRQNGVSERKIAEVKHAYEIAEEIHVNQIRQSGEPYILHPLHVAQNVIDMEIFDPNVISAAFLHDTIEDAEFDFTKEDIKRLINGDTAELVDGVTKMRAINFSSKENQNLANVRKIINGLNKDYRIIYIKLADRLHNMRTLGFKKREKQIENAYETLNVFVPLAETLGAYALKSELEDLSLKYINPEKYKNIEEERDKIVAEYQTFYAREKERIEEQLQAKGINGRIEFRLMNIYKIYKKLEKGFKLENIHDLAYFKVIVDDEDDCFRVMNIAHKLNRPINGRFKDYINSPRTNLYQSLHTTVTTKEGKMLKVKARTKAMNKVAAYGYSALANTENKSCREIQRLISEECQFAKKLSMIDESAANNDRIFKTLVSNQLLTDQVYVYTHKGECVELPSGSTALDFVCNVCPELVDDINGILINSIECKYPFDQVLKNNDTVHVITNGKCKTSKETAEIARQKILQMNGQMNKKNL